MQETTKKLKTKGLYVISMKLSSYRWCKLMSEKHELPIRDYSSRPIEKITDFFKLFDECLGKLDWTADEYTEEYGKAIIEMERRIKTNELGKWVVA